MRLIVHVVQEARDTPLLLVLSELARAGAQGGRAAPAPPLPPPRPTWRAGARMAASTASMCLRNESLLVHSHNSFQASARFNRYLRRLTYRAKGYCRHLFRMLC